MSATGPVLRDIHVPPAAWWPPAPGWWLVVGLGVALMLVLAWWWRHRRGTRPLQAALREVDRMARAFADNGEHAALAAGASRLLRRIALRFDHAAATARGDVWRSFIRAHAPDPAAAAVLERLAAIPFQRDPRFDAAELLQALRGWCARALAGRRSPGRRKAARDAERKSRAVAGQPGAGGRA